MTILFVLIPVALCLGVVGLLVFFWTMRSGQYDDLSGDAERILFDEDTPLIQRSNDGRQAPEQDRPQP